MPHPEEIQPIGPRRSDLARTARIGFNAAFYTGNRVGVDVFIENLVAELSRTWDLVVYTSVPGAFEPLGVCTRLIPKWTRTQRTRLLWTHCHLPKYLHTDRIDLLLSPFVEHPIWPRIPSIVVVHDVTPLVVPESSPPGYRLFFWLSLLLLPRDAIVVADSEHTRQDLARMHYFHANQVSVIPCGTGLPGRHSPLAPSQGIATSVIQHESPRLPPAGDPCGRRYILYVGGFLPHKDVPLLISSFSEVASEYPQHLVLVGYGPGRIVRQLESLTARLGLKDRVDIRSQVSDSELRRLYCSCDFFVYPSRYEGFGLPVLEAMACGAPVLCSRASSLPEVGGDAVLYFEPGSRAELLGGMRRLLSDLNLRAELAHRGRIRSRMFSWQETARAYSQMIRQLLSR